VHRTTLDLDGTKDKIKENQEKIKLNKQLPYLVGNIVEVSYVSAHSYLYFCTFSSFFYILNLFLTFTELNHIVSQDLSEAQMLFFSA
jgi:hypothetical protein